MSRLNRLTYEETTWPTNKYLPHWSSWYVKGKAYKNQNLRAEITKVETPINAGRQINNKSLQEFSIEKLQLP